jgi:hypothetical protein
MAMMGANGPGNAPVALTAPSTGIMKSASLA